MVRLSVRNESEHKGLARRDALTRLAERVCRGERVLQRGAQVEVSLLFCDDAFIAELNGRFRGKDGPTDVLSFPQPSGQRGKVRVLGDIVISLDTVARFCGGDRRQMREEVRLLFCHGLLHLLGHGHETAAEEERMNQLQAEYLGLELEAAWRPARAGAAPAR